MCVVVVGVAIVVAAVVAVDSHMSLQPKSLAGGHKPGTYRAGRCICVLSCFRSSR